LLSSRIFRTEASQATSRSIRILFKALHTNGLNQYMSCNNSKM